ncbi:MAG: thermonuclease family protein [Hyphomonadaceae bacterium]|jgi:endonuclease YncB( thermonuclease family)
MRGSTDVYAAASNALADFTAERAVTCELNGKKSYDRLIGTRSALGTDFGTFMIESGWSGGWKRFSGGKHAAAEKVMRTDRRGLWGLSCGEDLLGSRKYD